MQELIIPAACVAGGLVLGVVLALLIVKSVWRGKIADANILAERIRDEATKEASTIKKEAEIAVKDELFREKSKLEAESKDWRRELQEQERKLDRREEHLDKRTEQVDAREREAEQLLRSNEKKSREIESRTTELAQLIEEERSRLVKISGLTTDEAKELLLRSLEADVTREAAKVIKTITEEAREKANGEARWIIATAIQRSTTEHVSEMSISTVSLPSDDLKGRIIGREGRNIRAFESLTGVNLIIDDTPEAVVLSAFDPVRREIARITLERLVADGRIHPGRIEELHIKVTKEIEELIQKTGENLAFEAGVMDLHPELIKLLGRMKFRYSYGQNMIPHLREVTLLASSMAAELGANVELAKRGALLHDLGKAVSSERDGSHAVVGAEIAKRYGEKPQVVNCIASHHEDVPAETVEAVLVQVADAVSAARPGARREVLDTYVKRLEQLETIADSFPGVERAFAIQAGREVRIMVEPDEIDDQKSVKLAYDISKKIEEEMEYPGQIKVTVVRETRAVAYAH
ncbi:MAG TPA: ribonuclease Y [bacterium]|nr:ribonuclease Y [bacterium]HQO34537.1 ribonuclease Y [bacterium]HQP98324.1 ribonuclease Y [bacterium]